MLIDRRYTPAINPAMSDSGGSRSGNTLANVAMTMIGPGHSIPAKGG